MIDDPWAVLGLAPGAGDDGLRAAYLKKVREHPPDRAPREFERVRDAYQALEDPARRATLELFSGRPDAPLESLLDEGQEPRRFLGPERWLELMRKKG